MEYNSKLDLILGPMFSGKTTKLLEIMKSFDKNKIKYLAVKPKIDDRYTSDNNNFIVSHNLERKECLVSNNLKEIYESIKNIKSFDYIIIDEAQFFKNLYDFCLLCLEKLNINIIVTGLDGDFKRKPMGEILELLPIANTITKLSSKCNCKNCDKPGIFSHRIVDLKEQVLIGGSEKYIPLCRHHYLKYNNSLVNSLEL